MRGRAIVITEQVEDGSSFYEYKKMSCKKILTQLWQRGRFINLEREMAGFFQRALKMN